MHVLHGIRIFDKSAINNMETNRHNYMGIQPYTHINKLERDSNEIIKSL